MARLQIAFVKHKQNNAAQRGSQHDNTMSKRRRQLSTGQKKNNWQIQIIFTKRGIVGKGDHTFPSF